MATKNVTIAMDETGLEAAKLAASEAGLSFSAYMSRCEREARQRANGKRYREYLASLDGEDRQVSGDWDRNVANRILFTEPAS